MPVKQRSLSMVKLYHLAQKYILNAPSPRQHKLRKKEVEGFIAFVNQHKYEDFGDLSDIRCSWFHDIIKTK